MCSRAAARGRFWGSSRRGSSRAWGLRGASRAVAKSCSRCCPGSGLWVFGLAIFAARPYLPRASGWVALAYLGAGCIALNLAPTDPVVFGWIVAAIFGTGQLAAALVLFWNVERNEHG